LRIVEQSHNPPFTPGSPDSTVVVLRQMFTLGKFSQSLPCAAPVR
jgi:hypothetical protein